MAIYDKPTRALMRDMVDALTLKPGEQISRRQVVDWFRQNYPKLKTGTITAHLTRMSTNAPSRTHHNVIAGEDDLFYQTGRSLYRLYDPGNDPEPIYEKALGDIDDMEESNEGSAEDDGDELRTGSAEFAYEEDLKNYLAKNLEVIEPGLSLYEDEGVRGIEYPVGGRFIDILAIDASGNYVVVELKVSRGYDRVLGQLMRYMAWISENQADNDQAVRGIVVAREISNDLVLACSMVESIELYEYQLSLNVSKVR